MYGYVLPIIELPATNGGFEATLHRTVRAGVPALAQTSHLLQNEFLPLCQQHLYATTAFHLHLGEPSGLQSLVPVIRWLGAIGRDGRLLVHCFEIREDDEHTPWQPPDALFTVAHDEMLENGTLDGVPSTVDRRDAEAEVFHGRRDAEVELSHEPPRARCRKA